MLPLGSVSEFKTPPLKKKKVVESQELREKLDDAFSLLKVTVNKPAKERNLCTIYGELVAAKLQTMDERTREVCMNPIDNICSK